MKKKKEKKNINHGKFKLSIDLIIVSDIIFLIVPIAHLSIPIYKRDSLLTAFNFFSYFILILIFNFIIVL